MNNSHIQLAMSLTTTEKVITHAGHVTVNEATVTKNHLNILENKSKIATVAVNRLPKEDDNALLERCFDHLGTYNFNDDIAFPWGTHQKITV